MGTVRQKDFLGLARDIGRFNRRVDILVLPETKNTFSEKSATTWTVAATRWASIEPMGGREYQSGNQVVAECTHKIELLYYAGLSAKNRFAVTVDGVTLTFEIVNVNIVHTTTVYMQVLCKQLEGP